MSGEVQAKMCLLFDEPAETECRLWQQYRTNTKGALANTYELLSDLSLTISDAGLCSRQVGVVLDDSNNDVSLHIHRLSCLN